MAFLLLLLYVVVLFVRPQEWYRPLYGLQILAVIAGVAILTWLGSLATGGARIRKAPQHWLMLGLYIAVLMSMVSHTYYAGFMNALEDFGKTTLLYFLTATLINSVNRARVFLFVLIAAGLILAYHGILQAHTGFGFGGKTPLLHDRAVRIRAFGIFDDPNDLALILVTVLAFPLQKLFTPGASPFWRLLSGLSVPPLLYAIYWTNSRGGWLALAVMLVVFCFTRFGPKAGAALGVIALAALIAFGPSRVGTIDAAEGSARGRLIACADGNRMLRRWPLFGAGYGRFTEFSEQSRVAHNSFVHCYAELGLFGYFFWLGLIIASLKDGLALSRLKLATPEAAELSGMAKASLASLCGYCAAASFLSRVYIQPLYLYAAFVAALRVMAQEEYGDVPGLFAKRDIKWVLVAEAVSIPAIYVALRLLI